METETKRRRLTNDEDIWKKFNDAYDGILVAANTTRNYLLNDTILDWFHLYEYKIDELKTEEFIQDVSFMNVIFKSGNEFECEIQKKLKEKFGDDLVIMTKNGRFVRSDYLTTMKHMLDGVPIILNAVLFNKKNNTWGIADLIVRSDFINKLVSIKQLNENDINITSPILKKFHYVVIDIKSSIIQLCSRTFNMRNEGNAIPYKGQLTVYNAALGVMQEYTPTIAYIMGKKFYRDNEIKTFDTFDVLGTIDFSGFDKDYIDKTLKAIYWIRKVYRYGNDWDINPPSVPELYPNMKNKYDCPYHSIKVNIAKKINEITLLWNVGKNNRNLAHAKNIMSFMDINCSSETLGINGVYKNIIDKMIKLNRDSTDIIEPKKFSLNIYDWLSQKDGDLFIDIETINKALSNNNIIYLIGIGYVENDEFKYKHFMLDDDYPNDSKLIEEFCNYINNLDKEIRIFHWGFLEKIILSKFNLRKCQFIDMCEVFKNEQILIKGCFSFGLKEIGKVLYDNNLIHTTWKNNFDNGLLMMIKANEMFMTKNYEMKDEIITYNFCDCKVLYDIVNYLRKLQTQ